MTDELVDTLPLIIVVCVLRDGVPSGLIVRPSTSGIVGGSNFVALLI